MDCILCFTWWSKKIDIDIAILSVCHMYGIVPKRLNISSTFFRRSVVPSFSLQHASVTYNDRLIEFNWSQLVRGLSKAAQHDDTQEVKVDYELYISNNEISSCFVRTQTYTSVLRCIRRIKLRLQLRGIIKHGSRWRRWVNKRSACW